MKKGIILVAFGTSEPEARGAFDNVTRMAKRRFDGIEIRWAYTSGMIRRKLAGHGETIDSPVTVLSRMRDEGFTHVAVQSLHVIAGGEFDKVRDSVAMFRRGPQSFEAIVLGMPLLASYDDLVRVGKALIASFPGERRSDEAVVLMGHGSKHHPADLAYIAAATVFHHLDGNVFLGTVEGHPAFDAVLRHCKAAGITKAWLVPFMLVAGDHARNDMAGDDVGSWSSRLGNEGIESVPVLKGLGESDEIAAIWLDHLDTAMKQL